MQTPRVQLRLLLADGKTFGPGKADLLTLIQSLGSIAAAGREMKMSYKRAWDLVEEMNASFRSPLITTERGGQARGGAQVTELGAKVLAHYRMLEERLQQKGDPDLQFFTDHFAPDVSLPSGASSDMFDQT
jgi:molybdate transport system regulatory protein